MCRNIKTLYNFDPPTTQEEIHAASVQFVRKISGFSKPSSINNEPCDHAVDEIDQIVTELLDSLSTAAQPRNREAEAAKARARAIARFG